MNQISFQQAAPSFPIFNQAQLPLNVRPKASRLFPGGFGSPAMCGLSKTGQTRRLINPPPQQITESPNIPATNPPSYIPADQSIHLLRPFITIRCFIHQLLKLHPVGPIKAQHLLQADDITHAPGNLKQFPIPFRQL